MARNVTNGVGRIGSKLGGGSGSGTITMTNPFTRATGISTDSSNHVTTVTLGEHQYTGIKYNAVGLITAYNEKIDDNEKGWALTYNADNLCTNISQTASPWTYYSVTPASGSINEGAICNVTVSSNDLTSQTLYWDTDSQADLDGTGGNAYSGSFGLNGGTGTFSFMTLADQTTEGTETLSIRVWSGSLGGTLLATGNVSILDTSEDPPGLFEFTTATFTALTRSQNGPSLSEARALISGATGDTSWITNTTYFDVSSGILIWKIPKTATYRIKVAGGRGGPNYNSSGNLMSQDSRGAIMQAEFTLTAGDTLAMVVGSEGDPGLGNSNTGSCAGGGTFVWVGTSSNIGGNTLLLVGGGAASTCPSGYSRSGAEDGQTSTYAIQSGGSGSGPFGNPGQNGNAGTRGGTSDYDGGAGAGWLNNQGTNEDGKRFAGGADLNQSSWKHGGWGGGAGAHDSTRQDYVPAESDYVPWAHGRAGGGGYSGGSGNYYHHTGSGGASYCKSTGSNLATSNGNFASTGGEHSPVYSGSVSNLSAFNEGPGYVTITKL
tara:strand:+ start:435 stop:2075 length:1641 start_codon:yes stop_codon:yes gene_type:complete